MEPRAVARTLLLVAALTGVSCGEESAEPLPGPIPAEPGTTRQEVRSTEKVLILGTSVNGGSTSPEAQAVRDFWALTGRPAVTIDVKDAAQWTAMTPEQFMSYFAIVIGDASCTTGTAAFQAAVDTKEKWSQIIDGDVVIVGTNPSSGSKPLLMRNGIEHVIRNSPQFRTGLYVSLGCAYQNAPADTEVSLLSWLGDFKVQGSPSNCAAPAGHIFEMGPPYASHLVDDAYLGNGGCAARSVFTSYPFKNFSVAAIGLNAPGTRPYIDYTENPGFETPYFGTPYILVRGAISPGSGCGGLSDNVPSGEECDLGDMGNGIPASDGVPASETCSYSCQLNWCGDGVVDELFGEECDNGFNNGRTHDGNGAISNGMCSTACRIVVLPSSSSPPVARCTNVTVSAPANACGAPANINNGSSDPDGDLVGCTQSPASPYNIGSTTVTLTCTDSRNQTSSCSGVVTVRDVTPPTVTVGTPNRTLQCSGNASYVDLSDITTSELCSNPVTMLARAGSVNVRTPGSYLLTYSARDTAGNTGSATRTVNVVDTLAPLITLNNSTTMAAECGNPYVEPGWSTTDACYGPLNSSVVVSGTINSFQLGAQSLRYNLTDPSGNVATQRTRNVIVSDTQRPTVTIVGDLTQTVQCNDPAYRDPGATATDACAGVLTPVAVPAPNPGTVGAQQISYRATDPSGNVGTSSNSRTLNVIDTLPPAVTLNGPASMSLECANTWNDPGATANDQCSGPVAVTTTGSVDNRQLTAQTITYQAMDDVDLTDSKTRTVTVRDTQAPIVTLVGPLRQRVECNDPAYQDPGATTSDTCDVEPPTPVLVNPPPVGTPGSYTVNYQATDRSGNVGTSSTGRLVIVDDTLPPTLMMQGPNPQALECGTAWADPGASASDQCAGPLTVTRSGEVNHGVPSAYTVTYSVSDGHTPTISQTRTVSVRDTLPPEIAVNGNLDEQFECGSTYVDPGASASDVCAGPVPVTATRTGSSTTPGRFIITYAATDPSGNSVTSPVTRTVTVDDNTPPTLVLQGSPTPSVECGTSWTDPGATANDMCFGDLTASITRTGSVSTGIVGSYGLTYNVTDGAGLSATPVTRTVGVADTLPPTLTVLGPPNQAVQCNRSPYADPGATAADLCAGDLTAAIERTGSVNTGAAGTYTLSYRVSDPSGNQTTAAETRTVTVVDDQPPTISLNGPATGTHECGTPYNDPGATASDACVGDLNSTIVTSGSVNVSVPGNYTWNYSVTDPSGHDATASRAVTVHDTLAPQIQVLPGPSVIECNGSPYQDPGATASDLCAGDLTQSIVVSSNLDQTRSGQYTVTYRVTDAAGNVGIATRQLTVGPCSTCINIRLNDYNLFLLEDYNGGHDVVGKVAAGGNITMSDFAVGTGLPNSDISNTLVAGGNLSLNRGGVWGDARYGGSYSTNPSVTYPRGSAVQGRPIDFAARFAELRSQSARLAALPINGSTRRESWGGVMMRGTSTNVNVFDVNASAFNGAVFWSIDAPAGSFVVVNIRGASASFSRFGIQFSGGIDQHSVLFNFVDATSITAQGFGFWGTVLAPYAHVNFTNGSFDGGMYVKSFTGNAEGHINPLNNRDICP
jgi:choice-of-anchor A domain-containing protein